MSPRSSGTSTRRRSQHPAARRRLVLCVRNDGYQASLDRGKFYVALADRDAALEGQLRVIDESGEDYVYPKSFFATVALPSAVRRLLSLRRLTWCCNWQARQALRLSASGHVQSQSGFRIVRRPPAAELER